MRCGDAAWCVGEVNGLVRENAQLAAGRQEKVRSGQRPQLFFADDRGVDPRLDQARKPGLLENRQRVRTRRDRCPAEAGITGGLDIMSKMGGMLGKI